MIFASPAEHVRLLLRKMDEHLYNHFEAHEMGDMLFVHRYMYKYWPPVNRNNDPYMRRRGRVRDLT